MKSPSLNFPSTFRKISDTRLNGIHHSHTSKDDFQSGLLFPKLVFSKGTKNVNRVVNLNTACERKYRSWSDPSGEHTGDKDERSSPVQSVQICNDRYMNGNHLFVQGLRRDVNATRNSFETKSFCDTVELSVLGFHTKFDELASYAAGWRGVFHLEAEDCLELDL